MPGTVRKHYFAIQGHGHIYSECGLVHGSVSVPRFVAKAFCSILAFPVFFIGVMANPTEVNSPQEMLDQWKDFRQQVLQYLESIPDAEFAAAPEAGGWSPSQIAEHLYLTQWSMARALPAIMAGKIGLSGDECQDLDYEAYESDILKTGNAEAPDVVIPKENWDLATCKEHLQKAMDKTEKALDGKSKSDLQKRGIPHAIFGGVNLMDWMWIQAYHEIRHLNALKRKRGDDSTN